MDWDRCIHEKSSIDIYANLCEPLPFEENYADTIVSFDVLEHLPEPELFLKECYRILKIDGYLHLTVPFNWWVHEEPYDFYRFTKHGLKYLLNKVGFKQIQIQETTGFWVMWFTKFNYYIQRFYHFPLKMLIKTIWITTQKIALLLDRSIFLYQPRETAGYYVNALKSYK